MSLTFSEIQVGEARARDLLESHLTQAQRLDLKTNNAFNVTTPAGNIWRVLVGVNGFNNLVDPQGRRRCVYAQDDDPQPNADVALAMLLVLLAPKPPALWGGSAPSRTALTGEEFINRIACSSGYAFTAPDKGAWMAFYKAAD